MALVQIPGHTENHCPSDGCLTVQHNGLGSTLEVGAKPLRIAPRKSNVVSRRRKRISWSTVSNAAVRSSSDNNANFPLKMGTVELHDRDLHFETFFICIDYKKNGIGRGCTPQQICLDLHGPAVELLLLLSANILV